LKRIAIRAERYTGFRRIWMAKDFCRNICLLC
jgi:hypothetical protein